ncbi:MAG: FlgD immunoglobulin-like domain containing protein [candidate division Zixibacteria bacterium]|nr:FlgD immunoglobulin-like domain containing protein [candidate division Zixibacteria bacterium]
MSQRYLFSIMLIFCFLTLYNLVTPRTAFGQEPVASHMFIPKDLYNQNGFYAPRMNKTISNQHRDFFGSGLFNTPHGVIAYKILGGNIDTHEYLMVSDPRFNRVIASDQLNSWVASYGSFGDGAGNFVSPHGIANWDAHYYYIADTYNNRIVHIEATCNPNQPDECSVIWRGTYTAVADPYPPSLSMPMDVDVREMENDPTNYYTLMAVADTKNHRIVFYPIGRGSGYGIGKTQSDYGSGQLYSPTSLCFGRNTNGWQNSNLFVVDNVDRKLKIYSVGGPDASGFISFSFWGEYPFPTGSYLSSVEVDNKGLIYVVERNSGKVFKFKWCSNCNSRLTLLGVYGGLGVEDGKLQYPNGIAVAHGIDYTGYPNTPRHPIYDLADVFITESWGDQTGVRRFILGVDVLNLISIYYPYNYSTGGGNCIQYEYNTTDYANVTEKIFNPSGASVSTRILNSLVPGSHGFIWTVGNNPNGNYKIQITATSIYAGSNTDVKEVFVAVNKSDSIGNPIITEGPGLQGISPGACIVSGNTYKAYVKAFDPRDLPLTYYWDAEIGIFRNGSHQYTTSTDTTTLTATMPYGGDLNSELNRPHYLKVTIHNSQGGETIKSTDYLVANTPEECCAACPYVYTWSGSEFKKENTILAKSEDTQYFKKKAMDFYLLSQPLALSDSGYKLQIKEFENEHSFIDYLALVSIDYPASSKLGIGSTGKFYLYSNPRLPISCVDNLGQDCLSKIIEEDTLYLESNSSKGHLILNYGTFGTLEALAKSLATAPGGDPVPDPPKEPCMSSKPVPVPVISQGNILTVEVFSDTGWILAGKVYPRAYPGKTLVEFTPYVKPGKELKVKLNWEKRYRANQLAYYDFDTTGFNINRISLSSAYHSVAGDVTSKLNQEDNAFAELLPGEKIDLYFPYVSLSPEKRRDFVLISKGYYINQDTGFTSSVSLVELPSDFSVSQNYPNPFNPLTEIKFSLPENSPVKLVIFNVLGQKVKTLLDQDMPAGNHSVIWDGKNQEGKDVGSGIYFYRIEAGQYKVSRKMLIIK